MKKLLCKLFGHKPGYEYMGTAQVSRHPYGMPPELGVLEKVYCLIERCERCGQEVGWFETKHGERIRTSVLGIHLNSEKGKRRIVEEMLAITRGSDEQSR